MPVAKKAKVDVAVTAWEHFRNYLDSHGEDDEEGDIDELVEMLEILEPHVEKSPSSNATLDSIPALLPVLCSVAHYHLASLAISQTQLVDPRINNNNNNTPDGDQEADVVIRHLQASLDYFDQNAATWAMGANYGRMSQKASPQLVCQWYQRAADCASTLRKTTLELLEGPKPIEDELVKEWVELLILDGIVGAEYITEEDSDNEDEASNDEDEELQGKETEEETGYFSSSNIEATARFMAAMLLSTMSRHDEALQQLPKFQLTHRLHPNLWKRNVDVVPNRNGDSTLSAGEPISFVGKVLPDNLYERLCQVLAPDAPYWNESNYAHRGYYSYFFNVNPSIPPSNLVEDIIVRHLLPLAKQMVTTDSAEIVGAEWWPHTRPIQANLGHQLHFDTDEALLAQEGTITHPIVSSVLYLTGNQEQDSSDSPAGATIVLNQTPSSDQVAQFAWKCVPRDNTYMVFPGNLLHGVLPCPGSESTSTDTMLPDVPRMEFVASSSQSSATTTTTPPHRLTFMVGFWTRRVPEKMRKRTLYGPCGPLPPATEEHTWVREIQRGYEQTVHDDHSNQMKNNKIQAMPLPKVEPAWEIIANEDDEGQQQQDEEPPLDLPKAIDHRFFVRGAPQCFHDSLFQKDA